MPRFLLRNKSIGKVNSNSRLAETQYQISLRECVKSIYRRSDDIEFQIHKIERYENEDMGVVQKVSNVGFVVYNYNKGIISFNAINKDSSVETISTFKTKKFSSYYIKCEMEMYENDKFRKYIESIFNLDDELLFNLTNENNSIVNDRLKREMLKKLLDD